MSGTASTSPSSVSRTITAPVPITERGAMATPSRIVAFAPTML
jgi:hypothetical protein